MSPVAQPAARHWWNALATRRRRLPADAVKCPVRNVAAVVRDASLAIRLGCFDEAEALLDSAGVEACRDAEWLNLCGVVREAKGDWRAAKRFYGKAMRRGGSFPPAEQNMRRLYEMFTFGRTNWPLALGDERLAKLNHNG